MAIGEGGGFMKVVDPTARVFEYTSRLGSNSKLAQSRAFPIKFRALRCPDKEFAAALEEQMKTEDGGLSRFGALATALTKLSQNYHMLMPGYIILFIRTFLTLEGIAGVVSPGAVCPFAFFQLRIYGHAGTSKETRLQHLRGFAAVRHAAGPLPADQGRSRATLLGREGREGREWDEPQAAVAALRENFVTEEGAPKWDTLDSLLAQADQADQAEATAEAAEAAPRAASASSTAASTDSAASTSSGTAASASYGAVLQRVLGSPEGFALRRIFVDLDARQLLHGLNGRRGTRLRTLAAAALGQRLSELRWRPLRPLRPLRLRLRRLRAFRAFRARPSGPVGFEARQRERRHKSLRVIGGLQLQRFKGHHGVLALLAMLGITFRVYFWALVKALRFSAGKRFSTARPH